MQRNKTSVVVQQKKLICLSFWINRISENTIIHLSIKNSNHTLKLFTGNNMNDIVLTIPAMYMNKFSAVTLCMIIKSLSCHWYMKGLHDILISISLRCLKSCVLGCILCFNIHNPPAGGWQSNFVWALNGQYNPFFSPLNVLCQLQHLMISGVCNVMQLVLQ